MARKNLNIGRRNVLAAAGLLAAPAPIRAEGRAGVGLVVGNSKYQWEAALPNVRRDAPDVAKHFQSLGLKTELVQDAGREAMLRAFENFKSATQGANFAAFYFAGHGVSWENKGYLVPVDADLSDPRAVQTLVTSAVGPIMNGASHRLVVFDNCRNNPADGWRQLAAERTAVVSGAVRWGPNWLVLNSTAPGRIALDGPPGQNSPFAAAFVRQFNEASVDLQSLPSRLRRDLLIATEGRQVLWDRNTYEQPFSINGRPVPGTAAAGRSGWGRDPSKIVELPNAYAYARENGLPLPSGLIAARPAGNSHDSQKVGAFKFAIQSSLGVLPRLLIVMSVDEGNTAEAIFATKGTFNEKAGKLEAGALWRFVTAKISGDSLEFVPRDQGERQIYKWSDANSGSFSAINESTVGNMGVNRLPPSVRFTRLDG